MRGKNLYSKFIRWASKPIIMRFLPLDARFNILLATLFGEAEILSIIPLSLSVAFWFRITSVLVKPGITVATKTSLFSNPKHSENLTPADFEDEYSDTPANGHSADELKTFIIIAVLASFNMGIKTSLEYTIEKKFVSITERAIFETLLLNLENLGSTPAQLIRALIERFSVCK